MFYKTLEKLKRKVTLKKMLATWKENGSHLPLNSVLKQLIVAQKSANKYKVFVETGTYLGDMIAAQLSNFEKLYSIELDNTLYLNAKNRFVKETKVTVLNGDSSFMLPEIIPVLNQPCAFWLDGHYSGGETAKGTLECPILSELDAILHNNKFEHLILIDDARLFIGENDYPTILQLKEYIHSYCSNASFEEKYDMIIVKLRY